MCGRDDYETEDFYDEEHKSEDDAQRARDIQSEQRTPYYG